MKFSLWPSPTHTPAEVLEEARWADDNGWYSLYFADHYMPDTGTTEVKSGPTLECWAILPAVAAVTNNIRLGSHVSPTSVHHPAVLANRAATLDQLSQGRLTLGLGAGWQINEHAAYGIPLDPPGPRVSRFEEAIQVIRSLLREERTTFHGAYYDIADAPSEPKPVQSPLPLLVGTQGDRMLKITARFADRWNCWGNPTSVLANRDRLFDACEQVGRDPKDFWTTANAMVAPGSDPVPGRPLLGGSSSQLVDQLGQYAAGGLEEFILPDWNFGQSTAERIDNLSKLKAEVLDQV